MADKPTRKANAGAKPKLREAVDRNRFLKELERTGSRPAACAKAGVSMSTLLGEKRQHPEFAQQVKDAEMKARGKAEAALMHLAIQKKSERSLHYMMERKWWEQWGRRNPETYTIKQLIGLANGIGEDAAAKFPPEMQVELRRIIDKHIERMMLGGGGNGK